MHHTFFIALLLSLPGSIVLGQQKKTSDSAMVVALNQQIDDLVIRHDTLGLLPLYADDFVFSHGSGKVEGKRSWFQSVAKGNYTMRQHDSVKAEMHPGICIVRGKLNVSKKNNNKLDHYYLWYIRVYTNNKRQWQMISHTTYYEVHLPSTDL